MTVTTLGDCNNSVRNYLFKNHLSELSSLIPILLKIPNLLSDISKASLAVFVLQTGHNQKFFAKTHSTRFKS